jgi:hypothetical protein
MVLKSENVFMLIFLKNDMNSIWGVEKHSQGTNLGDSKGKKRSQQSNTWTKNGRRKRWRVPHVLGRHVVNTRCRIRVW